jgi:hypothetical protein
MRQHQDHRCRKNRVKHPRNDAKSYAYSRDTKLQSPLSQLSRNTHLGRGVVLESQFGFGSLWLHGPIQLRSRRFTFAFVLREALRLLRYLKLSDEISPLPRTAIAYSRVDMGRNPSAVPSSSKFLAFHLGSELGPIA